MPALMLHGAGGGAWEWNIWRRVWRAAGHVVEVPELQPSAAGLEATSWDDYLAQARAAAAALAPPRVFVGASAGGLLVLEVAMQVECAALVMVNPLPPRPEVDALPARAPYPARIPWSRSADLAATRRALPDADDAACLFAARRWRDESGRALAQARAGRDIDAPACPVLVLASHADDDVPAPVSAGLAHRLGASLLRVSGSHVGPLLGRSAATCAQAAVRWLNALDGFRTD